MHKLKALVTKITDVIEIICIIMLIICSLSAVLGVVMRYVFNVPLNWIEEICSLTLCWFVFLYQPKLENTNNQLTMTALYNTMNIKYKKIVRLLQSIVIIGLGSYLFYHALLMVRLNLQTNQATVTLGIPFWILYLLMPFSFGGMVIVHLLKLLTFDLMPSDTPKEDY